MAGSQGSSQWSSVQLLCPAVVLVHPECVTITTSILSFWLINLYFTTRTDAGVLKVMTTIQHEFSGHSSLSHTSQYFMQLCFPTLLTAMYFTGTSLFLLSFFAPQSFKLNIIHLPGTNNNFYSICLTIPNPTFSSTNAFLWNTSLNASLKNKRDLAQLACL